MVDNYNYGLDCIGGMIAAGSCAKPVVIDHNFIWNRNVYTFPSFCPNHPNSVDRYTLAPGLELWGDGITVTNNHFEYLTTTAIDATAVLNLTVENNMIRNTSRGIEEFSPSPEDDSPGIRIANCAPPPIREATR